jgi:hypothetical protein
MEEDLPAILSGGPVVLKDNIALERIKGKVFASPLRCSLWSCWIEGRFWTYSLHWMCERRVQ